MPSFRHSVKINLKVHESQKKAFYVLCENKGKFFFVHFMLQKAIIYISDVKKSLQKYKNIKKETFTT